jgi:hypothetical protein
LRALNKRVGVLLAAVAMAAVLLAFAGIAWAEEESALSISSSPTINSTPDDTWMTNGIVYSVIRSGNYIYVGGKFTRVRSEVSGGQSFAATNLARFDADTGAGDPTWTPDVTGADMTTTTVYALAASNGKIFVGGKFGAVNGIPRRNLAAVSPDTGAVDPTIDPVVGTEASIVRAMIASGTKVYIGGAFGTIQDDTGTKGRNNLAAINPLTGNVDLTWKPRADKIVWSLAFSCDGSEVFAGGKFLNAAGSDGVFSARMVIARFDATSGSLHRWAIPASTFESVDPGFVASDMAVTCERITSGFLGHPNWVRSFRLDNGETGSMAWGYRTGGDVQAVTMLGPDKVIIGGHFKWVKDRVPRTRIAMVNLSDGSADRSWNPAITGEDGARAIGPWDLLVDENHLYVGGGFYEVSGLVRTRFARFTFTP